MSKFVQISVAVAIEPDGTRVAVYAATDPAGRTWTATGTIGETPGEWLPMPGHPDAPLVGEHHKRFAADAAATWSNRLEDPPGPPELPDARTGTAARFWERAFEMAEARGTAADFYKLVEEWRRMYPRSTP